MSIIKIPVTAPTTRIDGTPLAVAALSRIEFFVSTDNGQNYVSAGHTAPDATELNFDAVDPGTYLFKAEAVDLQSPPLTSLDSGVVQFKVSPPVLAAPNPPTLGTPVAA